MSVRRAVPMQGAAGDPGDALTPGGLRGRKGTSSTAADPDVVAQGRTSGRPESGGSGDEAPEGADRRAQTAERAGAAAAPASGTGAARGAGVPEPSTEETPETASADSGENTVSSASSGSDSDPAAAHTATSTVGGSPDAVAAAAGSGGAGAGTQADGEPPGSRPKKPMLAAAAIIGVILVSVPFLLAGQDDDRKPEKDRTQNAAGTVLDTERSAVPETYTSKSPSPSVTPTKEKEEPRDKPSESPSAKPVIVPPPVTPERKPTATVTAKAPPNTAASALSSLAKADPGGRHICYRAFVGGSGWQAPVCDGTMAGTAGQGKRITALNIAVWNVGGSSANALLHDEGATNGNAKWAPSWTAVVADGKNNYIGSSKQGAPFLTGFAMNVGKGGVCHTAKMGNGGWGGQYCKGSRPEYMFVGTTDNKGWFEAVKLTV
ncbi:hydrogenase expression protein HypA [Streptomyces sp. AK04-4c]|uniref:hydrogenase expression protein HypA n=1 Tax=Streptomyces sp. AK04-4c TaxID=3028651 RepID=UPI0029A2B4BE|nr:hydrogenase expression protein HypA [Streptomyces sp. AK04-4c]MDX3687393.1 hydrogenase expression protein HypA [Streptomyces sp. AK04-4c]